MRRSLHDIEYPSCGSRFNLLRESKAVSYEPTKRERILHFELLGKLGTEEFCAN